MQHLKAFTFATRQTTYQIQNSDGTSATDPFLSWDMQLILENDFGFTPRQAEQMIAFAQMLSRDIPGSFVSFHN